MLTRSDLFGRGLLRISEWCCRNGVRVPTVARRHGRPDFGTCAYYRNGQIDIWVDSCAGLGLTGRQWSWPGYAVDRTPFGVLAHELGHHVDGQHGPAGGDLSHRWRAYDPEPLTGYCPNDNEWFAEMFRLFVTNPSLLEALRPRIYPSFAGRWPHLVETRNWGEVLADAPRQMAAAENRVKQARRRAGQAAQLPLR